MSDDHLSMTPAQLQEQMMLHQQQQLLMDQQMKLAMNAEATGEIANTAAAMTGRKF
jgi:hypothetical protein